MKSLRSLVTNNDSLDVEYGGYRSLALDPLVPIRTHVPVEVL